MGSPNQSNIHPIVDGYDFTILASGDNKMGIIKPK
jgi:hypothetical protein